MITVSNNSKRLKKSIGTENEVSLLKFARGAKANAIIYACMRDPQ